MGKADLELSPEARDLLAFLETEVAALRDHAPDGRLPLAKCQRALKTSQRGALENQPF